MHFFSSISLILTPAKKALGNFENKNILNFTGCFMSLMNEDVSVVVILLIKYFLVFFARAKKHTRKPCLRQAGIYIVPILSG